LESDRNELFHGLVIANGAGHHQNVAARIWDTEHFDRVIAATATS
jgi:hypothetical protein